MPFLRTKTKNALNTYMHSCGENYWKAMKGDKGKKRTFNKKKKGDSVRHFDGWGSNEE